MTLPTRSAFAQFTLSIGGPIEVELTARRVRAIEGTLTGITDDSIFIARPRQRDLRLTRGAVKKLYVSTEAGDMGLAGGILGLEGGLIVGGVGGAVVAGPRAFGRVLGGIVGAVVGSAIGAITGEAIGSHYKLEKWVEVPWPSAPSAVSAPR